MCLLRLLLIKTIGECYVSSDVSVIRLGSGRVSRAGKCPKTEGLDNFKGVISYNINEVYSSFPYVGRILHFFLRI